MFEKQNFEIIQNLVNYFFILIIILGDAISKYLVL